MPTVTVYEKLSEVGIRLIRECTGAQKVTCPRCSHTRKKKTDPCLSLTVTVDAAVWKCHNCSWSGAVRESEERIIPARRRPAPVRPSHALPQKTPAELVAWFANRQIPESVLDRNFIGFERDTGTITFPYFRNDEVINVKYRSLDKKFRQAKDAEKIYYGLDDIAGATEIIIVEGEIDKLSLEVAGFLNVVSVPDGAPIAAKDEIPAPEDDRKFEYVWNCRAAFEGATKIILATDGDGPGQALAEELSRRYGKYRCWSVHWPDANDLGCKDANEVLMAHGVHTLREVIANARPYPIKSLFEADKFETDALRLFRKETEPAYATGWPDIDALFKIRPGEFSVITGVPSSGKSQFVDALMVNLTERHRWKFALCSFENPPAHHIAKLAELHLDKPFWDGPRTKMTEQDLVGAIQWINGRFCFIRADDESPTIDWILETAKAAVLRHGIRGLVIDPYNEIEHKRPPGQTETEYVSDLIGKVKRFAQAHGVHVWFIAHPSKPARTKSGEYAEITLYDISGSAHWVNKADIGIVVVRDYSDEDKHPPKYRTEIQVKKVRFKEIGRPGKAVLDFDRATGRYATTGSDRLNFGERDEA